MKLKDYLKERKTNLLGWCRDNNLPYFSIRNILKGGDCFLSTAIQIEKITKGEVRCIDLEVEKPNRRPTRYYRLKKSKRNFAVKKEKKDQGDNQAGAE